MQGDGRNTPRQGEPMPRIASGSVGGPKRHPDRNTATPINVRTGRAGRPIPVGFQPRNIVFTPDSRAGYVANQGSGTVTPINVATNTAGKPIKIGGFDPVVLAITPDGRTVYVGGSGSVTPINVATNKPGKPITIGGGVFDLAVTPDGTTVYAVTGGNVAEWTSAADRLATGELVRAAGMIRLFRDPCSC